MAAIFLGHDPIYDSDYRTFACEILDHSCGIVKETHDNMSGNCALFRLNTCKSCTLVAMAAVIDLFEHLGWSLP